MHRLHVHISCQGSSFKRWDQQFLKTSFRNYFEKYKNRSQKEQLSTSFCVLDSHRQDINFHEQFSNIELVIQRNLHQSSFLQLGIFRIFLLRAATREVNFLKYFIFSVLRISSKKKQLMLFFFFQEAFSIPQNGQYCSCSFIFLKVVLPSFHSRVTSVHA